MDAIVEEACGDETTFPYLACSFLSWPLVQSQPHPASTSISVSPHPLCTPCSNSGCERTNPMQGQGFIPHCASKSFIWWCKVFGKPGCCILKQQMMTSRVRISSYLLYIEIKLIESILFDVGTYCPRPIFHISNLCEWILFELNISFLMETTFRSCVDSNRCFDPHSPRGTAETV